MYDVFWRANCATAYLTLMISKVATQRLEPVLLCRTSVSLLQERVENLTEAIFG